MKWDHSQPLKNLSIDNITIKVNSKGEYYTIIELLKSNGVVWTGSDPLPKWNPFESFLFGGFPIYLYIDSGKILSWNDTCQEGIPLTFHEGVERLGGIK